MDESNVRGCLFAVYSIHVAVADPEGGLGGLTPPSEGFFFCLSVYENSQGPGP